MSYSIEELQVIADNLNEYSKEDTVEHFRFDPALCKTVKYDIKMSPRLKQKIEETADNIKSLITYEKFKDDIVGIAGEQSKDD